MWERGVNGQFHIPAVLVPVTDCELVGPQRQVGPSEEITRLLLPTIEPRLLCVKFPRRPAYRFVTMLMIYKLLKPTNALICLV
jgi:hypothetical protein